MEYDDVIAAINKKAGHRKDTVAATASLELSLRSAENGLILATGGIFYPWFLLSELSQTETVAGETRVRLPLDFIIGYEDGELWYIDSAGEMIEMVKADLDQSKLVDPEWLDGPHPQIYALSGDYYRLTPTPDAIYNIAMIYAQRQPQDWASTEPDQGNMWLRYAPKLTIAMAAYDLMEDKRDTKGMAIQGKVIQEETQRIYAQTISRAELNVSRTMATN